MYKFLDNILVTNEEDTRQLTPNNPYNGERMLTYDTGILMVEPENGPSRPATTAEKNIFMEVYERQVKTDGLLAYLTEDHYNYILLTGWQSLMPEAIMYDEGEEPQELLKMQANKKCRDKYKEEYNSITVSYNNIIYRGWDEDVSNLTSKINNIDKGLISEPVVHQSNDQKINYLNKNDLENIIVLITTRQLEIIDLFYDPLCYEPAI